MIGRADTYAAHQRMRFMRPDDRRYLRPDASRFIRQDAARLLLPGSDPAAVFAGLDQKYSRNQPRIPGGRTGGGRWTDRREGGDGSGVSSGGAAAGQDGSSVDGGVSMSTDIDMGGADPVSVTDIDFSLSGSADDNDWVSPDPYFADNDAGHAIRIGGRQPPILDEFGEPYYKSGGHHEMPRAIYQKWDLEPETRQVFNGSTTGSLPKELVPYGPDGGLRGHLWDDHHRQYSKSVEEVSDRFLRENDIMDTRRMTPDQARDLLQEIRNSEEPRIRDYNRALRLIGRAFRSGAGRGSQ